MKETYIGLVVFHDFATDQECPFLFQGLGQPFPKLVKENETFRNLDMTVVEVTGTINYEKNVLDVDSIGEAAK